MKVDSKKTLTIGRPILRRWLDIILLAFIGVVFCLLSQRLWDNAADFLAELLQPWPQWGQGILATLFSVALGGFLHQLGGFRIMDAHPWYKRNWRYPPTWWAGIMGCGLFVFAHGYVRSSPLYAYDTFAVSAFALLLVGMSLPALLQSLWVWANRPSTKAWSSEDRKQVQSIDELSSDQLFAWLAEERPVERPEDDLFGAVQPAKRIARHLLASPLRSIGILGAFGSGKSSVLNLVEYYLENFSELLEGLSDEQKADLTFDPVENVITCRVGAWGLDHDVAASRVLNHMLKELSNHVDTLSITRLPDQYHHALSSTDIKLSATLFGLLNTSLDPAELLSRLDTILACAGLRLVVFLEDMDRNEHKPEFYVEIAALLDQLKSLRNVSFILACGTELHLSATLARICEHTEVLMPLTHAISDRTVRTFRTKCMEAFPEDIEPVPLSTRNRRLLLSPEDYELSFAFGTQYGPWVDLMTLFQTPRIMKSILRRVHFIHRSIHGELDFDDLLIATSLRTAVPDAFSFLHLRVVGLRRLQRLGGRHTETERELLSKELRESYDAMMSQNVDKQLAKRLIECLIPSDESSHGNSNECSQQICSDRFTDYWIRLNAEEVAPEELRDQEVLRALYGWRSDNPLNPSLASRMLSDERWADKIEQFGPLLTEPGELLRLAEQLFELVLLSRDYKRKESRGARDDYSGFIELWRLALRAREDQLPKYEEWVLRQIEKALVKDLRFSNDIYYFWCCGPNSTGRGLLDQEQQRRVRKRMLELARDKYQDNPELVVEVLEPGFPYCLRHLIRLFSEQKHGGDGFEPSEWVWSSDLLLNAIRLDRELLLPELCVLLSDEKDKLSRETGVKRRYKEHSFDFQFAQGIFEGKEEELMKELAVQTDLSTNDQCGESAIIEAVQNFARSWLKSHSHS